MMESCPYKREHIITMPEGGKEQPHYLLHCLIHAQLAEYIHHLFGINIFLPGEDEHLQKKADWVMSVANDWFVNARIHKLAPEEEIKAVNRLITKKMPIYQNNWEILPKELQVDCFFILARHRRIGMKPDIHVSGLTQLMRDVFLAVDPLPPTIENLESLINSLLPYVGCPSVERVVGHEVEVWKFVKRKRK
ncbi:MAG: hypothetical protein JRG73_10675 [Deltaproteobacteria bacterium]|nr:hypothetical protein [Deltaproteobacteria bacterium]MBW2307388.1 hypothetical protein [Deltaproteobacteria bacterium]